MNDLSFVMHTDSQISFLWLKQHLLLSDSLVFANQDEYFVQWLSDAQCK